MAWNPTTYEQLLAMMDGHEPPISIPPAREGKDALTDDEVRILCAYWKVFRTRLNATFEDAYTRQLFAGWIAEPWGTENQKLGDFCNWLDYSGTGERLGME